MNIEQTKPEQLAAGVMDYTPSHSVVAQQYAERLNAALARLGLTDRVELGSAAEHAIPELPAVVDVPLRKTLSVLMGKATQGDGSALATLEYTAQIMEQIFAWIEARNFAGDRPLVLPSSKTLATLPEGVNALLPRKISNGAWEHFPDGTPSDGIEDGVSLVRLLCDSRIQPTELIDDNIGWVMDKMVTLDAQTKVAHFNCIEIVTKGNSNIQGGEDVHLDALETSDQNINGHATIKTKRVFLNAYKRGVFRIGGSGGYTNSTTKYIYVGCKGERTDSIRLYNNCYNGGCSLEMVQLREGARQPFTLDCPSSQVADPYVNMNAENIVIGILEPLADNNYEIDGVTEAPAITINIGSANLAKLTDEQIAIATSKNYTLV